MSLHQFLIDNRLELIDSCRAMMTPPPPPAQPCEADIGPGVVVFLSQLGMALRDGDKRNPDLKTESQADATLDIVRSGTLHGQRLRQLGFTIEQVVRGYGNLCQAVIALADQRRATITISEFHTMNLCVDNVIAGAVSSWNEPRDGSPAPGNGRGDAFRQEFMHLVDTATVSFNALQARSVGSGSTTAAILRHCLVEMRSLLDDPKRKAD